MNYKAFFTKFKVDLGVGVKFATMNLADGTAIEAESFAAGEAVFIVAEDGNIPLPVGNYELEDGQVLMVEEEGVIASIGAAAEPEEEMSQEEKPEFVTKSEFEDFQNAVLAALEAVKPAEMEAEQAEEKVEVEASKEEETEEKVELSADEMPAAKPITQNPEKASEKRFNFKLAPNRVQNTQDRVRAYINNAKK